MGFMNVEFIENVFVHKIGLIKINYYFNIFIRFNQLIQSESKYYT